jgi:hypothetical protein
MKVDYTTALETRLRWLKWAKAGNYRSSPRDANAWDVYSKALEYGDTFLMTKRFAELVHHARQSIPDQLMFDSAWVPTKYGWLWIEDTVPMPTLQDTPANRRVRQEAIDCGIALGIHALGWYTLPSGAVFCMGYRVTEAGFSPWSFFTLRQGDILIDTVRNFDDLCADSARKRGDIPYEDFRYVRDRNMDMLHEVRWVYAAFHLMSQRLALTFDQEADRSLRRRFAKESIAPAPFLRVVTLRRMEAERPKGDGQAVDWHWQWIVRGHWQNQWYASKGEHKLIFIEAYVKGPENRPLKPPVATVYAAAR